VGGEFSCVLPWYTPYGVVYEWHNMRLKELLYDLLFINSEAERDYKLYAVVFMLPTRICNQKNLSLRALSDLQGKKNIL